MKLGIISFAHMHAFTYADHLSRHPDVELACIWDENHTRGKEMAGKYDCTFYEDLQRLLDAEIDAVVVCSENAKHKDHVIAAANAKKHILCEKPIATEIADAESMIHVCETNDVILQVAYPVRFSPAIEKTKEIIENGIIGQVLSVNATNHGQMPGGWFINKTLSGGGSATDHIVHIMDLLRWMLKDEVNKVYAEFDTRFYDISVEDCGIVTLELDSGVIVSIDPSWSRPKMFPTWGDVTMNIVGEEGRVFVDPLKQHSQYYNDSEHKIQHLTWAEDMDKRLVYDFIECIEERRPPFITGRDGLRTLEVVTAAYRSNDIKKVVSLHAEPLNH